MESTKPTPERHDVWRTLSPYAETLILIGLLAYARSAAAGILEDRARYTLFFVAPCYAVWRGGLLLGILSLTLTSYLGTFFFLPPDRKVAIEEPGDLLGMLLYVAVGIAIVLLGEAQRAEKRRVVERDEQLREAHRQLAESNAKLADANENLKATVERRTAQLEELRNWAAEELP